MAAIILAGVIVMFLVNLTGKPSVKYGIPFPVMVRASMGVRGANLPAMLRAIVAFFSFIALIITAGTLVLFGEALTNPADIVERVDSLPLTIIAALTFFAATVGINLVANFIPPAYDLANLFPSKISFKMGGLITAVIAFFVGALWLSVISQIGVPGFVNALGAVVAPFYGIIVVDYYLIKRQHLNMQELFSSAPGGAYYYVNGWNIRALIAFGVAALFSLSTVLVPALSSLGGYGWLIGAGLGGLFYYGLMHQFRSAHID